MRYRDLETVAAPTINVLRVWPEIVGAIVLLVIAAMGIGHGLRPSPEPVPAPQKQLGCVRFALIFGLTAINPATFVYFTAVAVTLARALRAATAIAVVVGVALASLLWQLLLVSAGAFLRSRATARVRRMTVLAGNAVIAAFGAVLVVHAFA